VTIFISTHFMNEAERCDRMSMMHAGKVLDSDRPAALTAKRGAATLEEAFIGYLVGLRARQRRRKKRLLPLLCFIFQHQLIRGKAQQAPVSEAQARLQPAAPVELSVARVAGAAARSVRATLALVGSLVLMVVIGFGISMDVEDLSLRCSTATRAPSARTM
jgi:ribosome-dependent ATPase